MNERQNLYWRVKFHRKENELIELFQTIKTIKSLGIDVNEMFCVAFVVLQV